MATPYELNSYGSDVAKSLAGDGELGRDNILRSYKEFVSVPVGTETQQSEVREYYRKSESMFWLDWLAMLSD